MLCYRVLDERGASRIKATAVIAAGAHALVLGSLAIASARELRPTRPAPEREILIPIEAIEEPARARAEEPPSPSPKEAPPPSAPEPRERARSPSRALVKEADVAEPLSAAAAASGDGAGVAANVGPGDGAGATEGAAKPSATARPTSDSLPPPLVPRVVPAPRAVFDVAPTEAEAKAKPLSVAGAVQASVYGAAESKAPEVGHGRIRVEIGANGEVASVTSSSTSWEAAARAIAKSLSGRRLKVPDGARGVTVTFKVDADAKNPTKYLKGDPRVLPPCGTAGRDGTGRLDAQPNMTCYSPGVRLREDVTIKLESEVVSR